MNRTWATAIAALRDALRGHLARQRGETVEAENTLPVPASLERLAALFGLSPFERDTLLLCAAAEFDGAAAALIAEAQGDPAARQPSFSLALAALPGAHWSALNPDGPLRAWRLVEPGRGASLTLSLLRIDEQILHYLAGVPRPHPQLSAFAELLPLPPDANLSSEPAQQVAAAWARPLAGHIQLSGADRATRRAVASEAATDKRALWCMDIALLPDEPELVADLARLWSRQLLLLDGALLLECEQGDQDARRSALLARFIAQISGPLLLSGDTLPELPSPPSLQIELRPPPTHEQRQLWLAALGPAAAELNGTVDRLASQFQLSPAQIKASVVALTSAPSPAAQLWQAARSQARPRIDSLAQRIEPTTGWGDLVLSDEAQNSLRAIVAAARARYQVYAQWGFAAQSRRGLSVSALFSGPSGTGKTSAAELIASELQLDLYRIDLSAVVSKYVGETEKQLRQVFDAAEAGGAILLFDEADALFGKRGEVKESHDRYANIEVSYLLQRIEAYRGLAILTTNMRQALDHAFLRRIRFVVPFPFPALAQREQIWRRAFPVAAPTDALDYGKLARLSLAGGNIHGIVLNAACLAAADGQSIGMGHLLRAARAEFVKLDKPLNESEVADWIGEGAHHA